LLAALVTLVFFTREFRSLARKHEAGVLASDPPLAPAPEPARE
jgi:hypothetical protein